MHFLKIALLSLSFTFSTFVYALDESAPIKGVGVEDSIQDLSIVLASGLAGGILGLSTLSFVDQPSKHLKNITMGTAIGVILGVGVVVFSQASKNAIVQDHFESPTIGLGLRQQVAYEIPIFAWKKSF